jgi:hypothetical protein
MKLMDEISGDPTEPDRDSYHAARFKANCIASDRQDACVHSFFSATVRFRGQAWSVYSDPHGRSNCSSKRMSPFEQNGGAHCDRHWVAPIDVCHLHIDETWRRRQLFQRVSQHRRGARRVNLTSCGVRYGAHCHSVASLPKSAKWSQYCTQTETV